MATHPWDQDQWIRRNTGTKADNLRRKRLAEIAAAVLRMKLRQEGRLK